MATSRTMMATAAHTGNTPRIASAMIPAAIASRSATGSSTLPSSETCPVRRAIVPSTQSVAMTQPNMMRPAVVVCSSRINATKTGISAIRSAEMALGTVSTRRPEPAAGVPSLVSIRRAGRIRTGDLLTPSQTR
jgi:hypothetical protein